MNNNSSQQQEDREYQPLWSRMRVLLQERQTKPLVIHYLIRWAKSFVESLNGKPLKDADFTDLNRFSDQLNYNTLIQPYQAEQAIDSNNPFVIWYGFPQEINHRLSFQSLSKPVSSR